MNNGHEKNGNHIPQRDGAPQEEHSLGTLLKWLGALAVGLLVVGVGVVYFVGSPTNSYEQEGGWTHVPPPSDMSGWIYMGLSPLDPESGSVEGAVYPYQFTFEEEELRYAEDHYINGEVAETMAFSFSPDDHWAVFIGAPFSSLESPDERERLSAPQVYLAEIVSDEYSAFTSAQQITQSTTFQKRFAAVSNGGEVVYASLTDEESLPNYAQYPRPVEMWSIRLVDANNEENILTEGTNPRFTGDDHFFFLKNDGVYLFDLATGEEKRMWNSNTMLRENDMIDVSDDGHHVALVRPDRNELITFVFSSGDANADFSDFTLVQLAKADVAGAWPILSPDARYVAVQVADWDELGDEDGNQNRIEFYRTQTGEKVSYAINLNDMDPEVIQSSDWRP